ncbi:hypothetical protein F5Y08DRAFT_15505 [Xylaria arbuscula]|nr:hypothetical protein F5Y08DRAFT_15505 [Xylaria arbuscula]
MSVAIQDLSDELVVRMASVLARRPEYGIAIPSRRWLQRQDEKIKQLPKELLRPSGLKRLAIKIADHIDPNIVDPQALLCKTHSALNPFLIRRLFIALAYEVTVHTDALRSWEGRSFDPELSALVGRLDSIVALWTAPELFHEIYGTAPFDGHHVFVQSGCEACCLAAVGASGRALADLRATLVNRMEERQGRKGPGKEPRLYRVVEAWIDQLRKRRDSSDHRAEQCRAWSDNLLVNLRMVRPQIKAWRAKQKKQHAELQAAKRPVYAELRRTSSGAARIKSLPPGAGGKRRTRNGIPVAVVDSEGAEGQRCAAMSSLRRDSIYRPDSLAGHSEVHKRERASRERTTSTHNTRPAAPEPARMSGPSSEARPTESFLHRYEQEIPLNNDYDAYENAGEEEEASLDEPDYVEESRSKVQGWFAHHLNNPDLDLGTQDDTQSVVSMVHPAFRPSVAHVAASAVPEPLRLSTDKSPTAPPNVPVASRKAPSEWTDCTVQTFAHAGQSNVPPVPRIPSAYRPYKPERQPSQVPATVVSGFQSRQTSTTTFPQYEDPFAGNRESRAESTASSTSTAKARRRKSEDDKAPPPPPPNWPAPPHGRGRQGSELFLPQSDVGSTVSEQRHAFLVQRFKPKAEQPPLINTERNSSTTTNAGAHRASRASSSVYSRTSVSSAGRESSRLTSSNTAATPATTTGGEYRGERERERTPKPPWTQTQTQTQQTQPRQTRNSSNAPPPSSVTQFGDFRGRM